MSIHRFRHYCDLLSTEKQGQNNAFCQLGSFAECFTVVARLTRMHVVAVVARVQRLPNVFQPLAKHIAAVYAGKNHRTNNNKNAL